jgi:transposase-like protein
MPEPARRIEVFTGAGRRRSWSVAEKAAIIGESYGAGETVCSVARRHGLTPQQLFAWRRLARQSALGSPTMFVPAVVEPIQPELPGHCHLWMPPVLQAVLTSSVETLGLQSSIRPCGAVGDRWPWWNPRIGAPST